MDRFRFLIPAQLRLRAESEEWYQWPNLISVFDPFSLVIGVEQCKGKPVQYANVTFFPQNLSDAPTGIAQTDADGKFSKVVSAGSINGAAVGTHFVTVTEGWPPGEKIPVDDMGQEKTPPRGPWAQKYRDSTSPFLKAEVAAGKSNHFEFDISK